jgi:hypothetical protein
MAEKQKSSNTSSATGKSSYNTTVLSSSTLHYQTERSKCATASEIKPKKTKLHEDEAGTSAEKRKKNYKAQKNKIVFLKLAFRSHKYRTKCT